MESNESRMKLSASSSESELEKDAGTGKLAEGDVNAVDVVSVDSAAGFFRGARLRMGCIRSESKTVPAM